MTPRGATESISASSSEDNVTDTRALQSPIGSAMAETTGPADPSLREGIAVCKVLVLTMVTIRVEMMIVELVVRIRRARNSRQRLG